MKRFLSALGLLLLTPGLAYAQTSPYRLTQTVGAGGSESFLTVDFQDGTPDHSYLFGYKYDGAKTGADLLAALAAPATGLGIGYYPNYGPGDSGRPGFFGVAVNAFSYNGHSQSGGPNFTDFNWHYWTGANGLNWTDSQVGASTRPLSNGSYDGWSWNAGHAYPDPGPQPVTPLVSGAVPEPVPACLVLLGLPLACVARRRARA